MADGDTTDGGAEEHHGSCAAEAEDPERLLGQVLALNGLFCQLNLKEVRAAFLQGKVIVDAEATQTLEALDAMSDVLFPRWLPTDEERSTDCDIATIHLCSLLTKSNSVFRYTGGQQERLEHTYAYWNKVINNISESPFWLSEEWGRGEWSREAKETNSEDYITNDLEEQKQRLRKLNSDLDSGEKVQRRLNLGEKYSGVENEGRVEMLEESDTDESKVEVSSDGSGAIKNRKKEAETHYQREDSNVKDQIVRMSAILSSTDVEERNTAKDGKQVLNDIHLNVRKRRLCKKRMKRELKKRSCSNLHMKQTSGSDTTEGKQRKSCKVKFRCKKVESTSSNCGGCPSECDTIVGT